MSTDLKEYSSVTIASDIKHLSQAEALVEQACNDLNVPTDYFGNILIAVTEAVNNAIRHGNNSDVSKSVAIAVMSDEHQVVFQVKDAGIGFDFTDLPDPTSPENLEKENGRGIFLMKALADEVSFEDGGSKVLLNFNKA